MAFDGVFPAPDLEPTEFGLFAVAKPNSSLKGAGADEKWIRGFSQLYETRPNYVRAWDETSSTSYTVKSDPASPLYTKLTPIFLEVEDQRSTLGLNGEDRFARVLRQLEGTSQKALEYELWNGEIALAKGLTNPFLSSPGVTVIHNEAAHGTPYNARRALSLLEHYTGEMSAAGEHGVVHLTRDIFVLMTSNNNLFMDNKDKQHMQTATGTQVIIGSGYSGDGPHRLISTLAVASGVGTVVTTDPHYLKVGETVSLVTDAGGTAYDGTWVVASVTNTTTFTLTMTGVANRSSSALAGNVQMQGDDNTKWIYATGRCDVLLGEATVVNENLAQGYDVSGNKNDMKIKATRAAVAYFDPSIHLAIKVDLTV
jgi:hypothetical protein